MREEDKPLLVEVCPKQAVKNRKVLWAITNTAQLKANLRLPRNYNLTIPTVLWLDDQTRYSN